MAVTRLDLISREPLLGGQTFGAAGAYEVLKGTVTFTADPAHPCNQGITDIALAARNRTGQVEWWADIALLRPTTSARSNRRLFFEVINRGRVRTFSRFDHVADTPDLSDPKYLGDAFVLQQGYTMAWCGWQWDVMRVDGLYGAGMPQAMDGTTPIGGQVLCQWWPQTTTPTLILADRMHQPYPTVDVDDPHAVLTVRDSENAPRQVIPREQWSFARVTRGEAVPATTSVLLEGAFRAGKIYECVYRTRHAPVAGLGLLAVRDVVSYLKYETDAQRNPCAGGLDYAYGFGASQSGRFLRHFLYLGLNRDEADRQVFDGLMPHVAGAQRGEFNRRFAQPSATALQGPNTVFPFTDAEQVDPVTDQRDGLLRRLASSGHCPKILYTNSSAEYWRGDAGLSHISVDGTADIALPDTVRCYLFAGTQHTPGTLPLTDRAGDGSRGQQPMNSVDYSPLLRAALVNLDRWVTHKEPPPPSCYPRVADGTAVPPASLAPLFQSLPGGKFPSIFSQPHRLDFGATWEQGIAAELPPKVGVPYAMLVPAVDADGNEIAGIRLPELAVPLATYTGWNLRHPSHGAPEQSLRMQGSTIRFAPTQSAREQAGDPRPAIAERYASREVYRELVVKAAEALSAYGYLLAADVKGMVQRALQRYDAFMAQS
jgi:hypothetical protein